MVAFTLNRLVFQTIMFELFIFTDFCMFGIHQVNARYYPNPYTNYETPEIIKKLSYYEIRNDSYNFKKGLEPFDIINFSVFNYDE